MAQLRAQVDKLLTNVSNGLFQELTSFGAERFLTPVPVKQQSGIIGKYGKNHLRVHANSMGGRGEAPRVALVNRDVTTKYLIENHGLEGVVTPEDYANVELPFDAERDEVLHLTYANLVAKEVALATTMADNTVITQNTALTGASQFSDFANSDPVSVFNTARETVRQACGFYPDTALLEAAVNEKLRIHPQIWDRLGFKFNQVGQLSQDNVGQALGVKRMIVVEGVYNSASEGQSDVIAPIWGKHMWFALAPQNPAIMQQSVGYYVYFNWRGKRVVYKYAINNPAESTGIQCRDDYDQLISDATCAYGIFNAIA
jgi:hypothetical protein